MAELRDIAEYLLKHETMEADEFNYYFEHGEFMPESMKAAFDEATDHELHTAGDYFRCAYQSLAISYRDALAELESNSGCTYEKLYIVGGGAKNGFLNRLTAEATGNWATK